NATASADSITVSGNVTAQNALVLTAREVSDASTFAQDITINSGVTLKSNTSSVTLNAGDDVLISSTAVVDANTTLLVDTSSDLDGQSSLTILGTLIALVSRLFTGGAATGTTLRIDD